MAGSNPEDSVSSMMVEKFPALAKGAVVDNPEGVKNVNTVQSSLTAFLAVVAFGLVSFGYIEQEDAQKIVMLVSSLWVTASALFSAISTVISSKKVGL